MRIPVDTIRSPADAVHMVRGVFYGWWLVGISVVLLTLMALSVFQGLGTFLVALQREFGWSRTVLSGAFSLSRAQGAVIGPIEGWLIDKVGNRRMILFGYLLMAFGFLMFSQVGNSKFWDIGLFRLESGVLQFYIAFITISLGIGRRRLAGDYGDVEQLVRAPSVTGDSDFHVRDPLRGLLVPVLALGIEPVRLSLDDIRHRYHTCRADYAGFAALRDRPEDVGLLPDGDRPGGRRPAERATAQASGRR